MMWKLYVMAKPFPGSSKKQTQFGHDKLNILLEISSIILERKIKKHAVSDIDKILKELVIKDDVLSLVNHTKYWNSEC